MAKFVCTSVLSDSSDRIRVRPLSSGSCGLESGIKPCISKPYISWCHPTLRVRARVRVWIRVGARVRTKVNVSVRVRVDLA